MAQTWPYGKIEMLPFYFNFSEIFGITPPRLIASPLVYLNKSYISEEKIIKTKLPTQIKAKSFLSNNV